jgi:DUF1365 family protein
MHSALYEGVVYHRRNEPVVHAFHKRLLLVYLDLGELDRVFCDRWLWGVESRTFASFRRRDHFGNPCLPLEECVRSLVQERTGRRPTGPIRLLTNLRYAGYVFNPASFFYCFDPHENLSAVVAEVTNTPWLERHCYVLDLRDASVENGVHRLTLEKGFHVSPFMGMDQQYAWSLTAPGSSLRVRIENHEADRNVFAAELALERREISGRELARALIRYPLATMQATAAIYRHAALLYWKGARFHPHP